MEVYCQYWASRPSVTLPEWFVTCADKGTVIDITPEMLVELYRTGINVMMRHTTSISIEDYTKQSIAFRPGSGDFGKLLKTGLIMSDIDMDTFAEICNKKLTDSTAKEINVTNIARWIQGKVEPVGLIQTYVVVKLREIVQTKCDTAIMVDDRAFTTR